MLDPHCFAAFCCRRILLDQQQFVQHLADQFMERAKPEKRIRTNLKGLGYEV